MQYTENLALIVFEENDIPSWLVSWNSVVRLIDTAYGTMSSNVTLNSEDIALIQSNVQTINTAITALTNRVSTNEGDITDLESTTSGLSTSLTALTTTVTSLASRVGSIENASGVRHDGVIGVGETTLTLSAPELTSTSLIDVYFKDEPLLVPTSITTDLTNLLVTVNVETRATALGVSVVVSK